MKVKKSGPNLSPELKAIRAVDPNTPKHSTKKILSRSLTGTFEHSLFNLNTKKKEFYTTYKLLQLAEDFIPWALKQTRCRLYQDYWWELGFGRKTVEDLKESLPEFKELTLIGQEVIDKLWGDMILGGLELKGDLNTIRQRAAIYIPEFKAHDKEVAELRAKLNEPVGISREDYLRDLAAITGKQVETTEEVRKIRERNALKAELDRRNNLECRDEDTAK